MFIKEKRDVAYVQPCGVRSGQARSGKQSIPCVLKNHKIQEGNTKIPSRSFAEPNPRWPQVFALRERVCICHACLSQVLLLLLL